jgi:hypothetical protein
MALDIKQAYRSTVIDCVEASINADEAEEAIQALQAEQWPDTSLSHELQLHTQTIKLEIALNNAVIHSSR